MYLDPSDIPPAYRREWAAEEKAIRIYEDPACFGASVASAEELTDQEPERWELLVDEMEAEPYRFDDEGRSYP